MVATARPLRTTIPYCKIMDFDALTVSNGARVICGNTQKDYAIAPESAGRLLNALKQHPSLRITLETGDCAYSNVPISDYETVISTDLAAVAKAEGALKILVGQDSTDILPLVAEALTEDLYYTIANGHLIQIMDRSATKWNGVQAMLNFANCSPSETIYFGDDHDDLEPIKRCGIGVAVANAIDAVKTSADYVADSNDADGVAGFLEKILL